MNLMLVGLVLFVAVIPLHFVKAAFRVPAGHIGAPAGLVTATIYMLASATSLMCYLAGPVLFCWGLWQLLIGELL